MSRNFPYDALLVLSYGGPEAVDEVIPFLQNVTRGRNIPVERLEVVGEHYYHFDGVSPLNRLNREMIANVRAELAGRGHDLPVYFGNRNWHPFVEDTAEQMAADGVREALVLATSAWGGYSAARQYDEDIHRTLQALQQRGAGKIRFTKLRQFFNHPGFIDEMAAGVRETRSKFTEEEEARLVFTAHSVPVTDRDGDRTDGPVDSEVYESQVREAARLIAAAAGESDYDVVWQSRSGPPHQPWLEPDVVDHVTELHEHHGVKAVLNCPVGFISDHMEVVWDLDTELAKACTEMGVHLERSHTVGLTASFAGVVANLVEEAAGLRGHEVRGDLPAWGVTVDGEPVDTYPAPPAD